MKITQDVRSQLDASQKQSPAFTKGRKDFDALVHSQSEKLQKDQLNRLVKDINAQGDRLAKSRSFQDLAKYKRLIKGFLEESVQYGMNLKHSHSWNMNGQNRKLTIVESVDDKLNELTETVMDQEKKSIDILGVIGEIKGLLINLYT
ncbi:YaaR family protein [Thalassobacillus hwangdonensis]|uniref:YaaR family protein n=1 Tax=Thalassobacillus hwangdonensis TaxID=546108 RepID=A0ABW3L6I3_9BACI